MNYLQKIVCKVDENLTKPLLLTDEVVSVISSRKFHYKIYSWFELIRINESL